MSPLNDRGVDQGRWSTEQQVSGPRLLRWEVYWTTGEWTKATGAGRKSREAHLTLQTSLPPWAELRDGIRADRLFSSGSDLWRGRASVTTPRSPHSRVPTQAHWSSLLWTSRTTGTTLTQQRSQTLPWNDCSGVGISAWSLTLPTTVLPMLLLSLRLSPTPW